MARDGSGTYSLPSGNPVTTGTTVSSTTHNNTMSDIASALTASVAKNGETTMTGNLPMGGFKLTGLADGSAAADSMALGQLQKQTGAYVSTVGGTADAITLTPSPAATAYAAGQKFSFISSGANTGATTVNVSALGVKSITKSGTTALVSGDIPASALIEIQYDGTQFQLRGVTANAVLTSGNQTVAGDKTFTGNNTHSGTQTISGVTTMSGKSLWIAEGAAVASASSTNIWVGDGNTVHITGTATINDFATAPQAGAIMHCIADAAFTIANSATITVPGNANYTVEVGDTFSIYAETTTTFRVINYQKVDGTPIIGEFTNSAITATTSGTSKDITGIPTWAKEVTIQLNNVSIDASTQLIIQIGDSGGIETTGYESTVIELLPATAVDGNRSTTYFNAAYTIPATTGIHGNARLTLVDASTNTWNYTGQFCRGDASNSYIVQGTKSLTAAMDRVRLTTSSGTANFDSGKFLLQWK